MTNEVRINRSMTLEDMDAMSSAGATSDILSALILFGVLGALLLLQLYLRYGHKLPSRQYAEHIQFKLAAMRINTQQLDFLYNNRDKLLHVRSYRKAMRFNNKW